MQDKKVSVIIPVYNAERFISTAVHSVLSQTYADLEVVIVDDNSADKSIEICQGFSDPRIKIIHNNKNLGPSQTRNIGIRHSGGAYLAFLDSDDCWLPTKLEKQVAHLEESPWLGMTFCWSLAIGENGNSLGYYYKSKVSDIRPQDLLKSDLVGNGSTPLIRRTALDDAASYIKVAGDAENTYFDRRFDSVEDLELWLRILLKTNWKMEGIPEILTMYRINPGGIALSDASHLTKVMEAMIDHVISYAPSMAKWRNKAKAHYMLWLSDLASKKHDYKSTTNMFYQALKTHWQILLEAPIKTLKLLAAGYRLRSRGKNFGVYFKKIRRISCKLIRSAVIFLALRLQFKPFTWGFAAIYRLAIFVFVFYIKRIENVSAIYLSGSLTRGYPLYGLSDIDFRIFIRGHKDGKVQKRLEDISKRLRFIFPMLGSPKEKGIYFIEDFKRNYAIYPYLRFMFGKGFYNNRLLWGDDVLKDLLSEPTSVLLNPAQLKYSLYLSYIWRFEYWMELVRIHRFSDMVSNFEMRYLFYKLIDEVSLIYLRLRDQHYTLKSRETVLANMKSSVSVEDSLLIDQLLQERRLFFRRAVSDPKEIFLLFKRIVNLCLQTMGFPTKQEIDPSIAKPYDALKAQDRDETLHYIGKIKSICNSDVDVVVSPPAYTPANAIDCMYFDRQAYVVVANTPISLDALNHLRRFCQEELINKAMLLIKEGKGNVFSVLGEFQEHYLSTNTDMQNCLLTLSSCSNGALKSENFYLLKYKLASLVLQIEGIVNSRDIYKMLASKYIKFFFSSLQNLILYRSILLGQFTFLTDLKQITDHLKKNTPLSASFIDRLYYEYLRLDSPEKSMQSAFFRKSILLLESFTKIVKENDSFDKLSFINTIEENQRLSLSVIIITKNRSRQLQRCLLSLAEQERLPDEVIVVDNGSTDSTKEVVDQSRKSLPIHYLYEPVSHMAKVRNAGAKISSGDIISFLDDDTAVFKQWTVFIEQAFLKDPQMGIVGGSIHNLREKRTDIISEYMTNLERW